MQDDRLEIARRLRILQAALTEHHGLTQTAVATRIGISQALWSNMLAGRAALSRFSDVKIEKAFPRVGTRWLRFGDRRDLNFYWVELLTPFDNDPSI
jgi:plasmid maintenance system antidote protein VapI